MSNIHYAFSPNTGWHTGSSPHYYHDYRLSLPAISTPSTSINMKSKTKTRFATSTRRKKTRRGRYYRRRAIPRAFPQYKICKMRYVSEDANYAPGATTGGLNFIINSFNDPGSAFGAQQPQYFTEMSAVYKNYKILSARWRLYIQNTTADMVQAGHCICNSDEVPPTSADGLTETIQRGKAWFLGATDENFTNRRTIVGSWSLKRTLRSKALRSLQDLSAPVSSAPAKQYDLHIALGSANNIVVKCRMVWDFIVQFYDLQQNAPD